jgi:phage baseplate assembly protein W
MKVFNPIGTAMSNPIQLGAGKCIITNGSRTIVESVIDILGTSRGENFMVEDYGSRLEETLFSPNDQVTFSIIKQMVIEALNTWEKRISIDEVTVSKSKEFNIKCNIYIKFTVVSTNLTDSFIYPFYEKLAT